MPADARAQIEGRAARLGRRAEQPRLEVLADLVAESQRVAPPRRPAPWLGRLGRQLRPLADRLRGEVLLEREVRRLHLDGHHREQAEQRQPVLTHALADAVDLVLTRRGQVAPRERHRLGALVAKHGAQLNGFELLRVGEAERGRLQVAQPDDAPLGRVRLEKGGLEQLTQLRDGHHRLALLLVRALLALEAVEHRRRGDAVQLDDGAGHLHIHLVHQVFLRDARLLLRVLGDRGGHAQKRRLGRGRLARLKDRDDHREHERVARHAVARVCIDRHFGVNVLHERGRALLTRLVANGADQTALYHLGLLPRRQGAQLEMMIALGREELFGDTVGTRGHDKHVALRREHLCDVALDRVASAARLVDAVEQQHRTPRRERLAQEPVDLRMHAVQRAQVGIDPIPRARKALLVGQQPLLQVLDPDEHGHQVGVGRLPVRHLNRPCAAEHHVHNELRHEARLAGGRPRGHKHAHGRLDIGAVEPLGMLGVQPLAQRLDIIHSQVAA